MRGGKASSEHLMGLNCKQKSEGLPPKETDRSFPEYGVIKNFLGIIFSQSSANMKRAKGVLPEGGNIVNLEQTPNSTVAHPYLVCLKMPYIR